MERDEGLYVISVAVRILDMHPQTLRKYERIGFVKPARTEGMLRLYSTEDITRLKLIKHLVDDLGLNLAGVRLTLDITAELLGMREMLNSSQDLEKIRVQVKKKVEEILKMLGVPAV